MESGGLTDHIAQGYVPDFISGDCYVSIPIALALKPDICDDRSLQHGAECYNTLIPESPSLALFADCGWGGCNGHANVYGDSLNFQIHSLACWIRSLPIPPRSEGRSVRGSECSTASLRATDLLIMNVCI